MKFSLIFSIFSVLLLTTWPGTVYASTETGPDYDHVAREALYKYDHRDFSGAEKLLETAAASAARENKPDWEATMSGFLGSIYERTGRYTDAEQALNRSINDWTRLAGPNNPNLVGPIGNLGELYYKANQNSHAEKLLLRALAIEQATDNDPHITAELLTHLGNVYFQQHKDALAEQKAQEALNKFALQTGGLNGSASAYSLLGAICVRESRLSEAESWLRKALTICESTRSPEDPRIAEGLANLAIFYSESGDCTKAQPLFERAAALFERSGGDIVFIRKFDTEYAAFERKMGHKKEAKELSRRVEKLWSISPENTIDRDVIDASALRAAN